MAMKPPGLSRMVSGVWMAALRILMGVMYLETVSENLRKGLYSKTFVGFVSGYLKNHPLPWFAEFMKTNLLPHWQVAGQMQFLGEVCVTISLLLGLFTPLGALVGIFLLSQIFLLTLGREWPWTYLILIIVLAVLMLSRAGRTLGIDAYLAKRFPKGLW